MKIPLSDFTLDELTELIEGYGEPKYRAKQIMRHIAAFDSYAEYTDVPKSLIKRWKRIMRIVPLPKKLALRQATGR